MPIDQAVASSLEEVFSFTVEDLRFNQQERLSPRQEALLRQHIRRTSVIMALFVASMALVPFGGLIYFVSQGNLPMAGLCVFLLVVLPLLGYLLGNEERRKWQTDLAQGVVASVYGPAEITPLATARRRHGYRLAIGSTAFHIPERQAGALRNGQTYCIYYAPRSHAILAVEAPETA
ncbi:MAG: hypothetical protein Kow0077_32810 [Anaerolineae bacterium]